MSHRITWRSRPRNGYPWPLRTKVLASEDDLPNLASGHRFIGPLSMAAACELIYRIKKLTSAGSTILISEYGDPPETIEWNGVAELPAGVTELDILAASSYDHSIGSVGGKELKEVFSATDFFSFRPVKSNAIIFGDPAESEIWKTPDGMFHLGGAIIGSKSSPGVGFVDFYNGPAGAEYTQVITASLVLKSGTFSIPMRIGSAAAQPTESTLTITATEWLPYETTAGSAAYNTATGAPINGGPAA